MMPHTLEEHIFMNTYIFKFKKPENNNNMLLSFLAG